uniref:Uncharacterized protein n=1 Tax=Panagrellus redivivus TaxID=6233 RepID=A0A7E4V7D7_PANRE
MQNRSPGTSKCAVASPPAACKLPQNVVNSVAFRVQSAAKFRETRMYPLVPLRQLTINEDRITKSRAPPGGDVPNPPDHRHRPA